MPKVDDEILRADRRSHSDSITQPLFNIDQKYDIGGTQSHRLEVFKVLNELQGYYGNQGYVAQLETNGQGEDLSLQNLRPSQQPEWSDRMPSHSTKAISPRPTPSTGGTKRRDHGD